MNVLDAKPKEHSSINGMVTVGLKVGNSVWCSNHALFTKKIELAQNEIVLIQLKIYTFLYAYIQLKAILLVDWHFVVWPMDFKFVV